jgi:hypothetical protein
VSFAPILVVSILGRDPRAATLCGLEAVSGPPQASGTTWSFQSPGQGPLVRPVEWQGRSRWNFACYFTGSVLFRRNLSRGERNRSRNDQEQQFRSSAHYAETSDRRLNCAAIVFSMRPAALARHYRPTVTLVGHRRFAMRELVVLLLTGRWLVGSSLRLTALRS